MTPNTCDAAVVCAGVIECGGGHGANAAQLAACLCAQGQLSALTIYCILKRLAHDATRRMRLSKSTHIR